MRCDKNVSLDGTENNCLESSWENIKAFEVFPRGIFFEGRECQVNHSRQSKLLHSVLLPFLVFLPLPEMWVTQPNTMRGTCKADFKDQALSEGCVMNDDKSSPARSVQRLYFNQIGERGKTGYVSLGWLRWAPKQKK